MTFVLVTFALLATTGLLMRSCVSRLSEAAELVNGLSVSDWSETSRQLAVATADLNEQISSNRVAWAE